MSGPIVRKYGFPNFEKIFGDRGLQHGVDETVQPAEESAEAPTAEKQPADKKGASTKGKKKP